MPTKNIYTLMYIWGIVWLFMLWAGHDPIQSLVACVIAPIIYHTTSPTITYLLGGSHVKQEASRTLQRENGKEARK